MALGDFFSGIGQNWSESGGFQGLMDNPRFQLGLGLMASGQQHKGFGAGLMGGLQNWQQLQAMTQKMKQQKAQAEQARQETEEKLKAEEQRKKMFERLSKIGEDDPITAARIAMESGIPDLEKWGMERMFPKEGAQPELYRIYELEQQGKLPEGTFQRRLEGKPTVSVNVGPQGPQFGSIPQGHMMKPTPEGGYAIERVPGYQSEGERGGQAKSIETYKPITKTIDTMKSEIKEHGQEFLGGLTGGETAAKMQAMHSQLMLSIAAATGQGALQEADRQVIEKMLPDPTSLQALKLGKEGLLSKYNQVQEYVESKMSAAQEAYGEPGGLGTQPQLSPPPAQQSPVQQGVQAPEGSVKLELGGTMTNPARPQSKEEFDRLPSGSYFRDPNGNLRRKP